MGTHLFKQWLFVRVLAVLHHGIHIRIHMHIYVRNPNHRIGYTCIYIYNHFTVCIFKNCIALYCDTQK